MGVSINGGTTKSSILMGFSPCKSSILGYPHDYGNPHIVFCRVSTLRLHSDNETFAEFSRLNDLRFRLFIAGNRTNNCDCEE